MKKGKTKIYEELLRLINQVPSLLLRRDILKALAVYLDAIRDDVLRFHGAK